MVRRGRRAVRALAVLLVLLVGLVVVGGVLSQTAWFRERLRRLAIRQADRALEGSLQIGSIEGTLVGGVRLRDVSVQQNGLTVVRVGTVELRYSIGDLLSDGRTVQHIAIDDVAVEAVHTADGWNVAHLLKPRPPADPNAPRATFTLPDIRVTNVQVTVRETGGQQTDAIPRRIDGLAFEGAVASSPRELSVDVRRLTFRASQPDLDLRSLAGRVVSMPAGWRFQSIAARTGESDVTVGGTMTRTGVDAPWTFDMRVAGRPVSLPEIERFVPTGGMALHPELTVGVSGTLDALALDVDVTSSEAGEAKGTVTLDATGPERGLSGTVSVADLDLAPIVGSDEAHGRITGNTTFDLRFPSATEGFPVDGTATFTGPRASAYGYDATDVTAKVRLDGARIGLDASAVAYGSRATTRGTITRPDGRQREWSLDLAGRIAGLDLRKLPAHLQVPELDSDVTGTYTATGPLSALTADVTLAASTVEGASLTDGTIGRFARAPRGFTFGATGTVAGLDVQRLGKALDVQAMTAPELAGIVNGTFDVTGEQRGSEGLRVDATGTLTDTTTYGGRMPDVVYSVTLDRDRVDVTAKGAIEGFPLETLTGTPVASGVLRGRVDAKVGIPDVGAISIDAIEIDGSVALDASSLFGVPFTTLTADVAVADGKATVRRLDGAGDGFTVSANGVVGLAPDVASDLRYRIEAASLVQPAKVADLPLTGAATTEGRVAGTRADVLVTGTIAGDQVAYEDLVAADTVTAQYAVRVPDWDPERVDVQASVDGQRVQVAGQTLPEVKGIVGYTDRLVRFDVTGNDAVRDLAARGSLALEETMQRLTLDAAEVSRNGVSWSLTSGTTARMDITPAQVTIGALDMSRGTQRVQVEGTIGLAADAESSVRVETVNVDIGDALVLAAQDVDADGVLNVSATLAGTRERPLVDGQVMVTEGRVRNIDVKSAGGQITFDGTLAHIDVEIDKDGFAKVTAKGGVPRTALDGRAGEHVAPSEQDKFDVAIVSTPIDIALAEGVTPHVTGLGGQAQVDVRVTGAGRDPHLRGVVFVSNGAFTVPATGVSYRKLDAIMTFEDERVLIYELGVESARGDRLSAQGELGLSREQANTVTLRLKGEDFRVLNNEFGVLDLTTDLTITGTVIAPSIEGTISVSSGRLELDEIVPQVSDTAYATRAEYQGIPSDRLRGAIVPDLLDSDDKPLALAPGMNTFSVGRPAAPDPDVPAQTSAAASGAPSTGEAAAEPASVFENLALNVQVRIPDNLVLRGQSIEVARASIGDINATFGGDFRVAKTAGQPIVLLGAVKTVRGTYAYQGRRFDILSDGQILFRGNEEIDPRLDITAQRVIQGVEARVRIQGTASQPDLSLSSDPPLDNGDILALIVFNQPLNQLGTGQQNSLSSRAGGIAAGFVVSPLAEALGSTLSLDQFEVETTDPNGRVNPAVVIGQQVTQDLFLRFRQQFGNQQVSQFLLEYRLADYLRLQGNVAEGDGLTTGNRSLTQRIEQYGIDLVFYFSF